MKTKNKKIINCQKNTNKQEQQQQEEHEEEQREIQKKHRRDLIVRTENSHCSIKTNAY